ncbi:hypothetical protein J4E91_009845 [Alternaria rosae]|nr:hypothetical protein J4E91_009845 [Alternaria rosae]
MDASSTNPKTFTAKKADGSLTPAQFLQSYHNLYAEYAEYAKLAAQFDGPRYPFGRERTLHNLVNARAKLEHDMKRLKNAYKEERVRLTQKLRDCANAPYGEQVYQYVDVKLCEALEQSRDTLAAVLEEDRRPPPGKLMKEKAELQNEKSGLLLQLQDLLVRYQELEKSRKGENDCNISNVQEAEKERDQLQGELDAAQVKNEDLRQRIEYLEEALGIS